MRLKPILFFVAVGCLAAYFVYHQVTHPNTDGAVTIGSKAPDFSIKDEKGKTIHLADFRGKLVFLNFFRTDCQPCVDEMPDLEVLNKMFQGRPFQMLIISGDTDWKTVDDFYTQNHLSLPTYLDPGWAIYREYHLTGTPETFLIDQDGSLVKHYIGPAQWTSPAVLSYLNKWVNAQAPAAESASLR